MVEDRCLFRIQANCEVVSDQAKDALLNGADSIAVCDDLIVSYKHPRIDSAFLKENAVTQGTEVVTEVQASSWAVASKHAKTRGILVDCLVNFLRTRKRTRKRSIRGRLLESFFAGSHQLSLA